MSPYRAIIVPRCFTFEVELSPVDVWGPVSSFLGEWVSPSYLDVGEYTIVYYNILWYTIMVYYTI